MMDIEDNQTQTIETPSPSGEATHFDDLINDSDPILNAPQSATLEKDEFHKLFCVIFSSAGMITGFKSFDVDEKDGKAKLASEAIYDTCAEIPALRFMIEPSGKYAQRIFAIGTFFIPMAFGIKNELEQRNKIIPQSTNLKNNNFEFKDPFANAN